MTTSGRLIKRELHRTLMLYIIEGCWRKLGERGRLYSGSLQLIDRAILWQFIGSFSEEHGCPEMSPFGHL